MNKILIRLVVFTFLCICTLNSIAQTPATEPRFPAVNIASPTATSLGKYVDFPVNLHTGVPNIEIPIYTVNEGPLQLPITLSYHASGLQVMEVSSWVGTGWALQAGGVISRAIKSLPDERIGLSSTSFYREGGFSQYFIDPNGACDYDDLFDGRQDAEPDLFTFSFGNYNGKFSFGEDGVPVLFPEMDVKIEPILNTASNIDYFQGFKFTDPNGVKYYFGATTDIDGDVDAVEKNTIKFPGGLATMPSVFLSWYLHKIESADGEFEITIKYRHEDYSFPTLSTTPCVPNCDGTVMPARIIVSGVAVSQIEFSNGVVNFVANTPREDLGNGDFADPDVQNTEAMRLDAIEIKSTLAGSAYCLSYRFGYDYFTDYTTQLPYEITQHSVNYNTDRKRLKLNSLQEFSDCIYPSAHSKPPYNFYYYDEDIIPRRLSFGQDHWGFSNGIRTNDGLLPPVSGNNGLSYYPGYNREPNWPAMRAGTLRMITYPTGGGAEYSYEPNTVTTKRNCTVSKQNILSVFAGMGGSGAEYGAPLKIEVESPAVYYYELVSTAGGSGKFEINNEVVATIKANDPGYSGYLFLKAGSYTLQAYADADNGSGVGPFITFYKVIIDACDNKDRLVGGLRVRKIDKFGSNDSPRISMLYEYGDANLYSVPTYIFKMKNSVLTTEIPVVDRGKEESGCEIQQGLATTFQSPTTVHPLQSVQGYHIGYKTVKEIFPDGGYTVNEYSGNIELPSNWLSLEDVCVRKVDPTICNFNDPVYPAAPFDYDFGRGRLLAKKMFTRDGRKVKETTFSEKYSKSQVGVFGVVLAHGGNGNLAVITHYDLKSARLISSTEVEKVFDEEGNFIVQESNTYFESPYHHKATRKNTSSQNGKIETSYVYNKDLTACDYECPQCAADYIAEIKPYNDRYRNNMLLCRQNMCASDLKGTGIMMGNPCDRQDDGYMPWCRLGAWKDYQYYLNVARIKYSNCIKSCKQNNNCLVTGLNSTNSITKALYLAENANQLNLVERANWIEQTFNEATFFNYDISADHATRVEINDIYTTEVSYPPGEFTHVSINGGVMQKDSKYSSTPSSSYIHKDGQIIEVKERNGTTTSYIWGYNNTVPTVKAVGANYTTLKTSFDQSPANLRTNPSLANAQITTYLYDPVVGIKTITDPNGKIVTYEYDEFGRLLRIKDHEGAIMEQYEYRYQID
jgi:YD repeat-containing protein